MDIGHLFMNVTNRSQVSIVTAAALPKTMGAFTVRLDIRDRWQVLRRVVPQSLHGTFG